MSGISTEAAHEMFATNIKEWKSGRYTSKIHHIAEFADKHNDPLICMYQMCGPDDDSIFAMEAIIALTRSLRFIAMDVDHSRTIPVFTCRYITQDSGVNTPANVLLPVATPSGDRESWRRIYAHVDALRLAYSTSPMKIVSHTIDNSELRMLHAYKPRDAHQKKFVSFVQSMHSENKQPLYEDSPYCNLRSDSPPEDYRDNSPHEDYNSRAAYIRRHILQQNDDDIEDVYDDDAEDVYDDLDEHMIED
jgi:hypothetical protein